MKSIDTDKLSKELNDTLIHRACIQRSGEYLASFLVKDGRSVDAIRLIGRCQVHDMSKITDAEEFMSLASIVDTLDDLKDINHEQSPEQIEAKKLHWKHNSHHPEYYDSPNDMTDLDLMEMACDCHSRSKQYNTNLIDYIKAQQDLRFHFDNDHFNKLLYYCTILVKLTKNDDYSSLLNQKHVHFDLKDSTIATLEHFDDSCYPEVLLTDRLRLIKKNNPDFASVEYKLYLRKENEEVGQISIKCSGFIEYKVYENYLGNYYATEALRKIVEISHFKVLKISIRKDRLDSQQVARDIGFIVSDATENTYTFKLKKK